MSNNGTHKSALKILSYLDQNPDAMDTENAISSWWISENEKRTRMALKFLLKNNILGVRKINRERYYFLEDNFKNESNLKELIISEFKKFRTPLAF